MASTGTPNKEVKLRGVRVGFEHVAPALPGCLRDDAIKVILHLCHVLTAGVACTWRDTSRLPQNCFHNLLHYYLAPFRPSAGHSSEAASVWSTGEMRLPADSPCTQNMTQTALWYPSPWPSLRDHRRWGAWTTDGPTSILWPPEMGRRHPRQASSSPCNLSRATATLHLLHILLQKFAGLWD